MSVVAIFHQLPFPILIAKPDFVRDAEGNGSENRSPSCLECGHWISKPTAMPEHIETPGQKGNEIKR